MSRLIPPAPSLQHNTSLAVQLSHVNHMSTFGITAATYCWYLSIRITWTNRAWFCPNGRVFIVSGLTPQAIPSRFCSTWIKRLCVLLHAQLSPTSNRSNWCRVGFLPWQSQSFFLSSRYGQTSASWRLLPSGCGRASSAECITKSSRCIGVVLIKIEMNVSGSSWKGRFCHIWWSTSDTIYRESLNCSLTLTHSFIINSACQNARMCTQYIGLNRLSKSLSKTKVNDTIKTRDKSWD